MSKLEKGTSYPGLEIIAKLATVLECDPAELLRVSGRPKHVALRGSRMRPHTLKSQPGCPGVRDGRRLRAMGEAERSVDRTQRDFLAAWGARRCGAGSVRRLLGLLPLPRHRRGREAR